MRCPQLDPGFRLPLWPCLAALLLACSDDKPLPSAPSEATPALSAAAATDFNMVSAGSDHTCGVTPIARAYCWGNNQRGQLGTGNRIRQLTPTLVRGGLMFDEASAGNFNTCGGTADDKVYCWGQNFPNGTTNRPTLVDETLRFFQVTAGLNHFCGVQTDNTAYCRGENSSGQLGDGTRTDRATPVAVAGGHTFRQISTSNHHTCAVTLDDQAYCWGDNSFGQLGDGNTGGGSTAIRRLRPTAVVGGHQFREISAGDAFTCAFTTDNQAYCWGRNTDGQLGDETLTHRATPTPVHTAKLFLQIDAGLNHVCGVSLDNRGFCWGRGAEGQLGNAAFDPISHGMKPQLVRGGLIWHHLSAGGLHSCGVTTSNVAYCWGDNSKGQLGDGTQASRSRPVPVAGAS